MDEDLTIEITRPKDNDSDVMISVSVTRTYLFVDKQEPIQQNGDRKLADKTINPLHSFAI